MVELPWTAFKSYALRRTPPPPPPPHTPTNARPLTLFCPTPTPMPACFTCLFIHSNCQLPEHERWAQKSSSLLSWQSWLWSHTRLYGTPFRPLLHVNSADRVDWQCSVTCLFASILLLCFKRSRCQQADCVSHARNGCVQWPKGQTTCGNLKETLVYLDKWIPRLLSVSFVLDGVTSGVPPSSHNTGW